MTSHMTEPPSDQGSKIPAVCFRVSSRGGKNGFVGRSELFRAVLPDETRGRRPVSLPHRNIGRQAGIGTGARLDAAIMIIAAAPPRYLISLFPD
jgi:hypothetical protein